MSFRALIGIWKFQLRQPGNAIGIQTAPSCLPLSWGITGQYVCTCAASPNKCLPLEQNLSSSFNMWHYYRTMALLTLSGIGARSFFRKTRNCLSIMSHYLCVFYFWSTQREELLEMFQCLYLLLLNLNTLRLQTLSFLSVFRITLHFYKCGIEALQKYLMLLSACANYHPLFFISSFLFFFTEQRFAVAISKPSKKINKSQTLTTCHEPFLVTVVTWIPSSFTYTQGKKCVCLGTVCTQLHNFYAVSPNMCQELSVCMHIEQNLTITGYSCTQFWLWIFLSHQVSEWSTMGRETPAARRKATSCLPLWLETTGSSSGPPVADSTLVGSLGRPGLCTPPAFSGWLSAFS